MRHITTADLADNTLRYGAFHEYYIILRDGSRLCATALDCTAEPGDEPIWRYYDANGDEAAASVDDSVAGLLDAYSCDDLGGADPDVATQLGVWYRDWV